MAINIAKFSEEVRDNRDAALALIGTSSLINTYRDALRVVCDSDAWMIAPTADPKARDAESVRDELYTAAIAAGIYGASRKQIEYIVSLLAEKNDFARLGYTRLTGHEAARLIDDLRK